MQHITTANPVQRLAQVVNLLLQSWEKRKAWNSFVYCANEKDYYDMWNPGDVEDTRQALLQTYVGYLFPLTSRNSTIGEIEALCLKIQPNHLAHTCVSIDWKDFNTFGAYLLDTAPASNRAIENAKYYNDDEFLDT